MAPTNTQNRDEPGKHLVSSVREYWDSHPLGKQYVSDEQLEIGSPEFFAHIRPWMNPFKFPWIMERIESEARRLKDLHLLEIGCGLGFDSLEFLKRGVKVTATDLTKTAVELTRKHFEMEGVNAEDIRIESVLDLTFEDNTFDAIWANGVLHHTGNTQQAVNEIYRALKPGGRAIISHFYRRPSWMYWISKLGRENIEYEEKDPPVIDFFTEKEILSMFNGFVIEKAIQDHYRALPVARSGFKAMLYKRLFRPMYNQLPVGIARKFAYKYSVIAVKK